ncbi:MAG: hypothetical protein H0V92_04585 [Pseudonocardiales bacterium]|nr:hypothetical protein [Pseudonocardiales bacterium]
MFDRTHALDYLAAIYAGLPGRINIVSYGDWCGRFFTTDEAGLRAAVVYAEDLDTVRQPQGVYCRTTTLTHQPASGRGLAEHTAEVPFLWGDVDYGTDGHKGSNLPPHSVAAEAMIQASGLPEPTLLVYSGGGLYPLWVFAERPEPALAAKLSEGVQQALAASHERHGFSYGAGVGDLARVLRLPGSVNRKLADEPRACYVGMASGELLTPGMFPLAEPARRPAPPAPRQTSATGTFSRGRGVFDAFAESAAWGDILEPAGWAYVKTERSGAELWLRPGGASSEYSARCFEHNVVCHSEEAGLPSGAGQRLTKARLFAHIWHGGDESEAARDLIAASRGEECTEAAGSLPDDVLAAIRGVCPSDDEIWRQLGVDTTKYETQIPQTHAQNAQNPATESQNEGSVPFVRASGGSETAASPDELATWLDTFTSNDRPDRLARRLGWMISDSSTRLGMHTLHLVAESIAGDYPAEHAVRALVASHQHHGGDPDRPRHLLSAALGGLLALKVGA